MSAFLLRLKANYLGKKRGYPNFSLWIPIAFAKIYFFLHGLNLAQISVYLVGIDPKAWRFVVTFMRASGDIRV